MTRAGLALVLAAAACAARPLPIELARAQVLEKDGQDAAALPAYVAAQAACDTADDDACAGALLGEAETLARLGRADEAAAAYERIPARAPQQAPLGARALVAAAQLHLARHRERRAYDLFWRVLLDYPDETGADDALRHLVADGRRRDPRQLYSALVAVFARVENRAIADNLLWQLALLARDDLRAPDVGLADLDRLAAEFPKSPLFDDALWEGGKLARSARDFDGAARRWRTLLRTREHAFIAGSYITVHLAAAQLELGRMLRDDQHRVNDALDELRRVERDYPKSTLVDDALYEIAATLAARGDERGACATLADLAKRFPDSNMLAEKVPALRARLGCP